ncbi:MAG: class I SAM-dependent methyltransferase [Actinomycetota bacterium]|nr:class I SAM-dependent methyltransferase [Actinomycetota bacterium]
MPDYHEFPNVARRNVMQEYLEVPALARLLHLPRGQRILEVGCGRGIALPAIKHLCQPEILVGLDIDDALIAQARAHIEARQTKAELVVGDVRALPFADASFDIVIDFGTCYHIDESETALCEIERVLSPGGLFVYETPVSQLLSHPTRSPGRSLPWAAAPNLTWRHSAGLWAARARQA